jgi:hypothetical protein
MEICEILTSLEEGDDYNDCGELIDVLKIIGRVKLTCLTTV